MSRIPQAFIDDLLSRLDIVNIIDSRVKLKRTGKNYAACCPFHEEKTPSFTVSPDKQFYYCFGCGASGNALGFIMEYERQDFLDAIETLARTAGVDVPREHNPSAQKHDFRRKKLYKILEQAAEYYQEQLKVHPQKQKVVQYLKNRGLTGQIAKDFGLGFAPPGRNNLLNSLGKSDEDTSLLIDSGLVISKPEENKKYDRFRHRIAFPIRDERGRVIGFGGRVLGDEKPKYLNSPETEVFHKGRELYGLYEARQAKRKLDQLIVVEGYMDVIALAQFGINNAVATLGTACGEDHLKLAFRFVKEITFCFDGDNAGRNAAKRALTNSISSMEDGRQIRFLFLPEGQDPDTLVRQIGAERFQEQITQAVPLEEFLFDAAAEGINTNSMDGRARFSKVAAPLLGQLPEGIFRELMFNHLATRTGLTREVLDELQKESAAISPEPQSSSVPQSRPQTNAKLASTKPVERSQFQTKQTTIRLSSGPDSTSQAEPHNNQHSNEYNSYQEHTNSNEIPQEGNYHDTHENNTHGNTHEQSLHEYTTYEDSSIEHFEPLIGGPQEQSEHSHTNRKLHIEIERSPIKTITIMLLDKPDLLEKLTDLPAFEDNEDPDHQRIGEIIQYLRKRPGSNFNNILGFWGGAKGIKEQQKLAQLMANHIFKEAQTRHTTYNEIAELQDAINRISLAKQQSTDQEELKKLASKGLSNLNSEEKQRYIVLTKKQSHVLTDNKTQH